MNPPKCRDEDYIQWLIASPKTITCTQASQASPNLVAHDSYTRLLDRLVPNSDELWQEVESLIDRKTGCLVCDDCTLDKPYGPHIELVTRHWSGKHRGVVQGINLITLLWTDGDIAIPVDYRIYNKDVDGLTKNDHLRQMLHTARQRLFEPECVLWDSWYSSLANLKLLRQWSWPFFVAMKGNRKVNPDGEGNRPISELEWKTHSQRGHLKGFGWVQLYQDVRKDGEDTRYFIGSEGTQSELCEAQVKQKQEQAYQIEGYHRGLKQECHIERSQVRKERKQRNHIGLSIRAFVRLEVYRYKTGISRFEAKSTILREAIRRYLADPLIFLHVNLKPLPV